MKTYLIAQNVADQVLANNGMNPRIPREQKEEILSKLGGNIYCLVADEEISNSFFDHALNVIRSYDEFPVKKLIEAEVDENGKVKTFIELDIALEVLKKNLHFLSSDQVAILLEMLPQSKYRTYCIGPIPFDGDDLEALGNVITEVEDFNDANYRNTKETAYWEACYKKQFE